MATTRCPGLGLLLGLVVLSPAQAAGPPAGLTPAQAKHLQQLNHWLQRANAHQRRGEIDEAIAAIHKGLALERTVFAQVRTAMLPWLAALAHLHEQREQFAEAEAARRELLRRREESHRPDDWRVTDARLDLQDMRRLARLDGKQRQRLRQALHWNTQVVELWQQGRSKEALPLAQKALAARRAILGEKHRDTAQCWHNLGAQHRALAQAAQAERCYRRALAIRQEVLGQKHPDCAGSLNNLATLYHDLGEYRRSLSLYEQALGICREVLGDKHPDTARGLTNLAAAYRGLGEHRRALPLLEQALRICKEVLGERDPLHTTCLNNLGMLYQELGEHRRALPLLEQALRIHKEVLGEQHPHYALNLNNLATQYQSLGEHRQALPLLRQALRIFKEVLGPKHPLYAQSLNNLASVYHDLGEHRLALPLYEEALKNRKEVLGERHPHYALSLHDLALLYQDMGEHRLALALLRRALRLRREVLGERHPEYAQSLIGLAAVYHDLGEYRQALPLLHEALRIFKEAQGEKHPNYYSSLNNLAALYLALGNQGAYLLLSGQALAVTQAHVRDCLSVLSERQRQFLLGQHASYLEVFLSGAIGTVPAAVLYEQVAGFKDITSTAIAEQHLARQQPDLRQVLDELRDVRSRLARLGGQVPPAGELARWRQRFDELDRRKTSLEQQLARASTAFALLRDRPTAARVATRLPARTALVEFLSYRHLLRPAARGWLLERRLLAFVVRGDREPVLLRLGNADHFAATVRRWRHSVTAADSAGPDAHAAELLRQRLWQPIARHLDGIDTVLVAPDSDLAGLPIAALPGDRAGSFLLEQYTFGYLTSGRQLLLPAAAVEGDGLLVLGGVDFGTPQPSGDPRQRPRRWPALPGAELEARQVEAAFQARFAHPTVRRLNGRGADRAGLLRALQKRWRYLHVATHGHFDPPRSGLPPAVLGAWSVGAAPGPALTGLTGSLTAALLAQEPGTLNQERGFDPSGRRYRVDESNPMLLSSLVLAGVNDTGEPGYLSAEEIALLDLSGCELAVLSACDTGWGHQARWLGVQGLQRGFHQAGARHVLASLWSVSDPATSVLMQEFYDQLWQKRKTPREALRQAQLAVLKDPGRVRRRAAELRARLVKRGVSDEVLQARGILPKAKEATGTGKQGPRSPVAWWAAFVLSGRP
jgi:CHAT domain-containing protein/tetratricopeptide (TPR) repeat protein